MLRRGLGSGFGRAMGFPSNLKDFDPDVSVDAADTYLSLPCGRRKFAVACSAAKRMDVGIKLKGDPVPELVEGCLTPADSWNSMVIHRV
jgi:hypothetical protein